MREVDTVESAFPGEFLLVRLFVNLHTVSVGGFATPFSLHSQDTQALSMPPHPAFTCSFIFKMWTLGVDLRCLQGKCFICPFLVDGLVVLTQPPPVGVRPSHIHKDCRVGRRVDGHYILCPEVTGAGEHTKGCSPGFPFCGTRLLKRGL